MCMCGRYLFFDESNQEIRKMIEAAERTLPEDTFRQLSLFEVFPSQRVLAGVWDPVSQKFGLSVAVWGYEKDDGKLIINARSETADTSPFFAGSFPCCIPASGYYEWSQSPRHKYYFTIPENTAYLACFGRRTGNVTRIVILTEDAEKPAADIHSRQPVIFSLEDAHAWCKGDSYREMVKRSIRERTFIRV